MEHSTIISASAEGNEAANPAGVRPALIPIATPSDQLSLPPVPDIKINGFWHVENLLEAQQAYYQQRRTVNEIVELARKEFGYITLQVERNTDGSLSTMRTCICPQEIDPLRQIWSNSLALQEEGPSLRLTKLQICLVERNLMALENADQFIADIENYNGYRLGAGKRKTEPRTIPPELKSFKVALGRYETPIIIFDFGTDPTGERYSACFLNGGFIRDKFTESASIKGWRLGDEPSYYQTPYIHLAGFFSGECGPFSLFKEFQDALVQAHNRPSVIKRLINWARPQHLETEDINLPQLIDNFIETYKPKLKELDRCMEQLKQQSGLSLELVKWATSASAKLLPMARGEKTNNFEKLADTLSFAEGVIHNPLLPTYLAQFYESVQELVKQAKMMSVEERTTGALTALQILEDGLSLNNTRATLNY